MKEKFPQEEHEMKGNMKSNQRIISDSSLDSDPDAHCSDIPEHGAQNDTEEGLSARVEALAHNHIRGGLGIYTVDSDNDLGGYENYFSARRVTSGKNHWSIAWSDLMMTMFILFMVMFVYQSADREFLSGDGGSSFSGNQIGREVVPEGAGGVNEFNAYGRRAYSKVYDFSRLTNLESEMRDFAQINLAPDNTLRIILTGDLLFPLGGIALKDKSLDLLQKIAIFLKDSPYLINVLGHTDNTPMRGDKIISNWELSTNRASAVARYLIGETRLPSRQFSVTGYAEFRPVVPNDSPGNRAKNRRVEIVITKEKPAPFPLGGGDL